MLRRWTAARVSVFHLLLACGACSAPAPIEGGALERLKADVKATGPGPVLLASVGPRALGAGGPEATVVMPFLTHGKKVAEFPLYDGYFKVALVVVSELRALGIAAACSPGLWSARTEAVAFETRSLDDRKVEVSLAQTGAQDDVGQIWRLTPTERRSLLVSRLVLLSARSGLEPALRAKKTTAREIRELYFGSDASGAVRLDVEAIELDAVAEEGSFGGERRGRAKLRFRLWTHRRSAGPLAEREVACEADAEGTGVAFEKLGATYSFSLGVDDPLELAIRGCVRAFVAEHMAAFKAGRL